MQGLMSGKEFQGVGADPGVGQWKEVPGGGGGGRGEGADTLVEQG